MSIIGLPPLGGAWSKWSLLLGAANAENVFVIGVLVLSSILNAVYLVPVFARAFFERKTAAAAGAGAAQADEKSEAPIFCLIAPCLTALACFALFFFADEIADFIAPVGGE